MGDDFDLILASSSPRRRDLLRDAGIPFRVLAPGADEASRPGETPGEHAERNARSKAEWVAGHLPADCGPTTVLSADTIVALGGMILEKPLDADDARDMLATLSGQTHCVCTGVCIMTGRPEVDWSMRSFVEQTRVTFRPLSADEIAAYVSTGEPFDKAGAYAIQDGGAAFVSGVDGSYSNVVGLPMERVVAELRAEERKG